MTSIASRQTSTDEIPAEVVDRIVLAVDHAAEQARRSATINTRPRFRRWVLRRNRQVRFARAWGMR